jgi:hypothetical protein
MTLAEALVLCNGWNVDPASGGVVTIEWVDVLVSNPAGGWVAINGTAEQQEAALLICREWL